MICQNRKINEMFPKYLEATQRHNRCQKYTETQQMLDALIKMPAWAPVSHIVILWFEQYPLWKPQPWPQFLAATWPNLNC